MSIPIVQAHDVYKTFESPSPIEVLKGVSLTIYPGESIAITGKSGSGKSTLLHILGGLDSPTKGDVLFPLAQEKSSSSKLRSLYIGFVFQGFHLLEDYSLLENIEMPGRIARKKNQSSGRALDLLDLVGLIEKKHTPVKLLSGGEKQRAAIARAFYNDPDILMVDEGTGSLDVENAAIVQDLLLNCCKNFNKSLLLVTHDSDFASLCNKTYFLKNGVLTPK